MLTTQCLLSEKLLSGLLVSPSLPGLGTSLHTDSPIFSLGFSQTVGVKVTRVDSFNFMESLNLLGSNLGLWPGLGLFQVLEWLLGLLAGVKAVRRFLPNN